MAPYYRSTNRKFHFVEDHATPRWRSPQRGALGALLAHWSVHHRKPALLAIPTGAGKTAIALAAPHLMSVKRVLVVVPSTQLREQTVAAFKAQEVLRDLGALQGNTDPKVVEVAGKVDSWSKLSKFDVVVGLPQSVSPEHYEDGRKPPVDLFDMVIIDEAHHSSARTWRAILEHFEGARKVLLTATPRRRDGKRVPGDLIFHFPLRAAIDEGFYKEVEARILDVADPSSRSDCDVAIRDEIVSELSKVEHSTSALLIRGGSRERVKELVALYEQAGIRAQGLTSDMGQVKKTQVVEGLKDGSIRAVVVAGMLSEGFDLPRLRLAAYHDKHKSLATTIQLIGRLVRTHADFPQPSVLVTVRDAHVYPTLRNALWDLYEEDADWSSLLPGIIDGQVTEDLANKSFADRLSKPPTQLALESILPAVAATVYEVRDDWEPDFLSGDLPSSLQRGSLLRGEQVLYSAVTPGGRTLLLVSQGITSPRWSTDSGLDTHDYSLHLVTYIPSESAGNAPLLLVNSGDGLVRGAILGALDATTEHLRSADPVRLQRAFDALPRLSVSNIGVRNTYGGGRGTASYKMFAGSGVDGGMREADTAQAAMGHAMAQISQGPGRTAYNAGFAVEKAKFWESRYVPLREYDAVLDEYAERYRSAGAIANPLLPAVARGVRLEDYPNAPIAAVELHGLMLASPWELMDGLPVARLVLEAADGEARDGRVTITATRPDTDDVVWVGSMDTRGEVRDESEPLPVRRGHYSTRSLGDLLLSWPPTIFFSNGETVSGATLYQPVGIERDLLRWTPQFLDWRLTNIEKETDRSAEKVDGGGESIHETLRKYLVGAPTRARRRWVLENDGSGELADLVVLEILDGYEINVELWHAKPAGGPNPSVRVSDMQVVVAQAIKSRRWFSDRGLWEEMGERYADRRSPRLKFVGGSSESLLKTVLGLRPQHLNWSMANRPYLLRGSVVIAQPGLSWGSLEAEVARDALSAIQVRDLLAVFDDSLGTLADSVISCSR